MTVETRSATSALPPALQGQRVVVLAGGTSVGLEVAALARDRGAEVILGGSDPARLRETAEEIGADGFESFDLADLNRIERFFRRLPAPVDHVLVTGFTPHRSRLSDMDFDRARRDVAERILVTLAVARFGSARMRPPGTLLFVGSAGERRIALGNTLVSTMVAALPALVTNLALELAPIRVNLIAPASSTGPAASWDAQNAAIADRTATTRSDRALAAKDVAALAVHLMTDTALTGMTFDLDGRRRHRTDRAIRAVS